MSVRWGIIGCGDVTEVKSGPGFQETEGSELVAVMRRNAALAEDYARRHGVPRWYSDADALIHDPNVDAVYIATPPGSHCDYALRVCAAGKPAYVEKPMARNFAECQTMTEAFRKANLPLFVAFYRRALPRFLKAKEIVESGGVGRVTSVCYRFASPMHHTIDFENLPWRVEAKEAGGGVFMDLGCHTLDIIDFMVGPLHDISGAAANVASPFAVEDSVAMHFRLASGGLGTASWNFASDSQGVHEKGWNGANHAKQDLIEIFGTEGYVALSTFGQEPVRYAHHGVLETFDLPNPKHIQQPFIQTIIDSLLGRGVCHSTGDTAMRTAKAMDLALQGYYGSREDAFWEREAEWSALAKRTP